ncbi:MAG TPA: glycosyltransferase 87 family protein, partial [Conexibacter sp.]|nr:glycosyltransferase 87 family protein [Conexibacter sp.]
VAYMPAAALAPVRDGWDVANGALWMSAGAAIAVAWLLARIAGRAAGGAQRGEADPSHDARRAAALRAALAWLVYPPLVVTVSTGTSDVLLAALLAAALALAHRRLASASLIVLAGWFKLVPFALLPIWLARLHGRRLAAALALLAASAAVTLAALVALGGAGAPGRMLHALAFQLDRRTLDSPWPLLGIEWLQPLAQAGVLALVAAATVRARRDPALAEDPARLAALAGAVMLALQLSGNYWTYLYLAWAIPCIVVSLLATTPHSAPQPVAARSGRTLEPALV